MNIVSTGLRSMSAEVREGIDTGMPANQSVDFRSDTVTQPDKGMRRAMAEAVVGDDCYGDDPSVNLLERRFARLVGKQAAVFFPSGTQSNLSAILAHCGRGDELLVGSSYHTFTSEAGGASVLGGVSYRVLPVRSDGCISPEDVASAIQPDDPHYPESRLLCLENTFLGQAISLERMQEVADQARHFGLAVHLDGARIFNAAHELGLQARDLAAIADTVSACLSKGLGAPAGTMLACDSELEPVVRRNRKVLGGAMRQSGILAAAGLYALDHNVARLGEDHRRARLLADMIFPLRRSAGIEVSQATNMVFLEPAHQDHAPLRNHLVNKGFLITDKTPAMRFVLHLGHTDCAVERFAAAINGYFGARD